MGRLIHSTINKKKKSGLSREKNQHQSHTVSNSICFLWSMLLYAFIFFFSSGIKNGLELSGSSFIQWIVFKGKKQNSK